MVDGSAVESGAQVDPRQREEITGRGESGARTQELLEAALSYAREHYWRILPLHNITKGGACSCGKPDCSSPGKHPRTLHGLKDATTNEATLRQWWTTFPLANIGILTGSPSTLLVLDVDERHGGDETLRSLQERYGPLPQTVVALTGGGEHYYFAHPGGQVPNSAGNLGPGLDVRGDGGYVVAPPSLHPSGRLYCWEGSSDPNEVPKAAAPGWLLNQLWASPARKVQPSEAGADDMRIPQGGRNIALTSMAGSMRRRGFTSKAILAALTVENEARCDPPLGSAELEKIASSVGRYTPADSALLELEKVPRSATVTPTEPTAALQESGQVPADWLRPGDGLAARPVPMARVSLAGALPTLDRSTRRGLPTGSTIGVLGGPDTAKTGTLMTIADVAERQGFVVVHLTNDNGREPAEIRWGQMMGFDRDRLEEGEPKEIARFRTELAARNIFMPDPDLVEEESFQPINTLSHVIEETRRFFLGRHIFLLVDSVQTVLPDGGEYKDGPRLRVIAVMKLLRKAANIPGWIAAAASQINREAHKHKNERKNTNPLTAGAESGSIEFGFDLMLYLESTEQGIHVKVTKNKPGAGRKPEFPLIWDGDRARVSEPDAATFADESLKIAEQAREQLWGELEAIVNEDPGLATSRIAAELKRAGRGRRSEDVPAALRQMARCEPPRIRREKQGNAERWYPIDAEPIQRTL